VVQAAAQGLHTKSEKIPIACCKPASVRPLSGRRTPVLYAAAQPWPGSESPKHDTASGRAKQNQPGGVPAGGSKGFQCGAGLWYNGANGKGDGAHAD
jgi:hypothetical protein